VGKEELMAAAEGHILGTAETMAVYERQQA
jgi:hypothetical protein